MISDLSGRGGVHLRVKGDRGRRQLRLAGDPGVTRRVGCLHALTDLRSSVGSHSLQIKSGGHNLDIIQTELRSLGNNFTIDSNNGTSIVIETVTIASSLVSIQVDASTLGSGFSDQLHSGVELSQLVVGSGGVGEDLHTIERHANVGRLGREQLLTGLKTDHGVLGGKDTITKRHNSRLVGTDILHKSR